MIYKDFPELKSGDQILVYDNWLGVINYLSNGHVYVAPIGLSATHPICVHLESVTFPEIDPMETQYERVFFPLIDGTGIDREIAEETPCDQCKCKCDFEPSFEDGLYRAFSVCRNPECKKRIEF